MSSICIESTTCFIILRLSFSSNWRDSPSTFVNDPILFYSSSWEPFISSVCPNFIHCPSVTLYVKSFPLCEMGKGQGGGGLLTLNAVHWYQCQRSPNNNVQLFLSGLFHVYVKPFYKFSKWLGSVFKPNTVFNQCLLHVCVEFTNIIHDEAECNIFKTKM